MSNLGLPVPPGFTISTEACQAYLKSGHEPEGLAEEVSEHLELLEAAMGKRLGQSDDPLLVSVRSGAKFSMPGMMETVLNVGLNDQSVRGLAAQAGDERFAFDSYRRLIQMFGKTVLDIDGEHFDDALEAAKRERGSESDLDLQTRVSESWPRRCFGVTIKDPLEARWAMLASAVPSQAVHDLVRLDL